MTPQGIPTAAVQAEAETILKAGKFARGFLRNYWAKPGRHDSETPLKT